MALQTHGGDLDGAVREAASVLCLWGLAAVGVPMAGPRPAVVWVTGPAGEEPRAAVSDLLGAQETVHRGLPGLPPQGRSEVEMSWGWPGGASQWGCLYTCGHGTRLWRCLEVSGEELDYENMPGVSRTGATVGENCWRRCPQFHREETGSSLIRDHAQQGGRRQAGGRVCRQGGESNLGDSFEGEDRLRGCPDQ